MKRRQASPLKRAERTIALWLAWTGTCMILAVLTVVWAVIR